MNSESNDIWYSFSVVSSCRVDIAWRFRRQFTLHMKAIIYQCHFFLFGSIKAPRGLRDYIHSRLHTFLLKIYYQSTKSLSILQNQRVTYCRILISQITYFKTSVKFDFYSPQMSGETEKRDQLYQTTDYT